MQSRSRWIPLVTALAWVALVAVAGCAKKSTSETANESTGTSMNTPAPAESTGAASGLTDANIAAIVVAANDADVSNGNAAKGKTKNVDVRQFAEMMVTDHGASNKQAKDLAHQLNLTPEDNATSDNIKKGQDAVRDSIKKLDDGDFDKAYMDNEVSYHQTVLDAITNQLIPNAQNEQLKKLLEDTKPVVERHLQRAQDLQQKLATGHVSTTGGKHKGGGTK